MRNRIENLIVRIHVPCHFGWIMIRPNLGGSDGIGIRIRIRIPAFKWCCRSLRKKRLLILQAKISFSGDQILPPWLKSWIRAWSVNRDKLMWCIRKLLNIDSDDPFLRWQHASLNQIYSNKNIQQKQYAERRHEKFEHWTVDSVSMFYILRLARNFPEVAADRLAVPRQFRNMIFHKFFVEDGDLVRSVVHVLRLVLLYQCVGL